MQKTPFQPYIHGFAFVNSWRFTWKDPLLRKGARFLPQHYGLCGGMAFAALDYYLLNQPLPRGTGPTDWPSRKTSTGRILHNYLWKRQLESWFGIVPRLFTWMIMLHSRVHVHGAGWLLEQTKGEWRSLKGYIDRAVPWPICLVGRTTDPFNNHQVLVYGYDDPGDGTVCLYVYDMNCPDRENTIWLDFRGDALHALESCASTARGALRGFFCAPYTPAIPPRI